MTRIEAFIPTESLFNLLNGIVAAHSAKLVFQRFESEIHPAGFTTVAPTPGAAKEYIKGGYQLIYISLKNVPKNTLDWDFLEREEAHLVELAGARQQGQDLEQVVIRPLAKKSKAAKLFGEIQAAIAENCLQGVTLNGKPYPKIFYAKESGLKKMRLWVDVDTKSISAVIS